MKKRIFLIHGWGGYPEEGWRPWLKNELSSRGFEVFVPEMPDTNSPKMNAWLELLSTLVGNPNKQCFFVGHSLGVITILRYLESLTDEQEIGGAVFVAGFTDDKIKLGETENIDDIRNFFQTPLDFEKIKKHCSKFVTIQSDDDPYVDLHYGDILKEKLNAELIVEHAMKHFSGDDGITQLPHALESVIKISS